MLNNIIIIILLVLLYFYEESKNNITEKLESLPCIKMQENCDIAFITTKKDNSDKINLIIKNYKNYCKNCRLTLFVYDKIYSTNEYLNKILIIKEVMKNERYKNIIWMDSKQPIKNLMISFERIIDKYNNFNIIFPYNGSIILDYFIVKNCPWSKDMIDRLEDYVENNENVDINSHIKTIILSNKILGIKQKIKLADISEFDEIVNDKKIEKESTQSE